MQLATLMHRFSMRVRMLGAIALMALALLFIGAIGVAAQLYANAIATGRVTRDISSFTELARLQQATLVDAQAPGVAGLMGPPVKSANF